MDKILYVLGIALKRIKKGRLSNYEETKLNKYNPLTYLFLVIAIPIGVFMSGWPETKRGLKDIFKWR